MGQIRPIKFSEDCLSLLDQRKLPHEELWVKCKTLKDGHNAIRDMVVRGAPCIGFTAIYSLALWLKDNTNKSFQDFEEAANYLSAARPTAVNLDYEIKKVLSLVKKNSVEKSYSIIKEYGDKALEISGKKNLKMAQIAVEDLFARFPEKKKFNILTHCNTGSLACGSMGTAFGVIEYLNTLDRLEYVWASETRPYLQGSRLTAYELVKNNLKHSIIVEGAVSLLMDQGKIDAVFVGADRVAKNGDTANKIGTSNLSILAAYYKIPFYVIAPSSSFDLNSATGKDIEIELRPREEISMYKGHSISPLESDAFNPSFDISKGDLITGIISEFGISLSENKHNCEALVKHD